MKDKWYQIHLIQTKDLLDIKEYIYKKNIFLFLFFMFIKNTLFWVVNKAILSILKTIVKLYFICFIHI